MAWYWLSVTVFGVAVMAVHFKFHWFADRRVEAPPEVPEPERTPSEPSGEDAATTGARSFAATAGARFLRRLPPELGRELVSLSMQDHYIRVTTRRGSTLVLMRFADAMGELADYPGAQIHRSHWVAADSAGKIVRRGARLELALSDGARLPVSKSFAAAARRLADSREDRLNDRDRSIPHT